MRRSFYVAKLDGNLTRIVMKDERDRNIQISTRQLEIIQLIAEGKTQKEIGVKLGISVNTVTTYLKRLYLNIDVHTSAQAVAWYYKFMSH